MPEPKTYAERVHPCGCRGVPDGQHLPGCKGDPVPRFARGGRVPFSEIWESITRDPERRARIEAEKAKLLEQTRPIGGLIMEHEQRVRELEEENARLAIEHAATTERLRRIETFVTRLRHALDVLDADLSEGNPWRDPGDVELQVDQQEEPVDVVPAHEIESIDELPESFTRGITPLADQDTYE